MNIRVRALIGAVCGAGFAGILWATHLHRATVSAAIVGGVAAALKALRVHYTFAASAAPQFIYWTIAGVLTLLPPRVWQRVLVGLLVLVAPICVFVLAAR